MRTIYIVSALSIMLVAGTLSAAHGTSGQPGVEQVRKLTVRLGPKSLQAVVADTEPLRVRGLLGWTSIEEDQGMLLVFERQGLHAIHMQRMKFPIDALWIDAQGVIRLIYRNIQPNAGHAFPSFYPSTYCLEIKAGFCDKYGIKEGQTVQFQPVDTTGK